MSEAVKLGLEAQAAALALEDPKTAFTAENLSNLGTIASQNGYFDLAENYYLQSIGILKLLHGEDSVDVALATVPLAQLYGIYLHRFDDSIHLLERAMDVMVVAFEDQEQDHPAVEEAREILERVYTALENTRPDSRATTRPSSRGKVEHMTTEAQSRPTHGSVATPSTQAHFTSDYFDLYDDNVSILSDDSLLRQKSVDGLNEPGDIEGGSRRFNSTQLARELLELPHGQGHGHGVGDNFEADVPQSPLPLAIYSTLKSRPSSPEAGGASFPGGAATVSMAEFEKEMAGGIADEEDQNQNQTPQPQREKVIDLSPALNPGGGSEDPGKPTPQPVPSSSSPKQEKTIKPQHTQLAKIKALSGVGASPRTDSGSSDPGTGRSEVDSKAGSKHSKSSSKRRKPGRKKGDIEEDEDAPPPEVDDDLKQEIAQANEEFALQQIVQVFPVDHASFEEDSTHLNYSVEFLDLAGFTDPAQARHYMCRGNEEAYVAAVGQTFAMPIFPPQIKEGGRYKPDFLQCARHVMSARIQRLMLEDQLRELRERNQQFVDLYTLCVKKKAAFHQRLLMLEGEMENIAVEKQGHLVSPGSRFGAFLSTKVGWVVVFEFLSRECKRLQLPEDKRALAGEVVNEHLTLDDVFHHWELMQTWQLLHSVFFRCRAGAKSYPIASKGPGGDPNKGIQKVEAHVEEDEAGKSLKSVHGKPAPIINTDPSTSILAGQEAAARAAIDEVVESASVQDMLADDNSSIASRPSVVRIKATEGEDDASLASKTSGKGSKASEKSKKSKEGKEKEDEEQGDKNKGGGGGSWGFGFSMFGGKKEEAKVEVLAPVERKLEPFVNGTGLGEWSEVCEMLGCPEGQVSLLAAARQVVSKLGAAGSVAGLQEAVGEAAHAPAQPSTPRSYSSSNPPPLGRILQGIIPLVLKSDIQMALESMSPTDETNPFLYNAMKQVLDAVADHLEKLMIESLRLFSKWAKALEVCRKDRVRKAGGRMDQNHDGEVEVDKHGTIRVIPHADDIVDTDILHGSRQRIQVTIVMPVLEQRISLADGQESKLRGELACVVQFGYSEAAPFIQRIFRGTLARIRKARVRKDLVLYAMHAAAFTIQGRIRAKQGRRNFSQAKSEVIGDLRDDVCRILQRNLRGWVKRHKFQRYKEDKRYRKWWFGLSMMQAIIRGFNARHRVRRLKAGNKEDQQKEEKLWNVELLQRVARGYIARKTIVRSLRIRKTISKRVLLLAEQYLQRGDLWSFLKEIDDEFARLGKEINHTKQREDDFADTFIEKVLQKRQGEFDGAWDKFGRAVTAQSENRRAIENGQAPGAPGASSSSTSSEYLTAVGAGNVTKAPKGARKESEAGGEANIPGPLLRRAVSATVQEGVRSEIQRQREGQDRGIKLTEKIKDAYNPNPSAAASSSTSTGNKKQTNGKKTGNSLASKSLTSLPSSQAQVPGNPKVRKELEDAIRIKKKKKSKQPQPNNLKATTDNFLASAVSHDTGMGFAERNEAIAAQPVKGWKLDTTKAGESLLVDIPKGVDDTMERLLRATALRCFVPEFFSGYDADSAYRMYLMLPPGLAKMRYEQEAFRYCQPAVTQLRVKGVNLISDAMPPRRVRQFLTSVKTPSKLLEQAMDNLFLLIKLGDVPVGLHHSPTMKKQSDLSEGKGTVAQAISAAASEATTTTAAAAAAAAAVAASPDGKEGVGGSPSPPKPSWRREMSIKRSEAGKSKVADALEAARAAVEGEGARGEGSAQPFQPPSSSQSSRPGALAEEGEGDDGFDGEGHNEVGDPTLPSRLLLDMVEHGPWASMTSSIDDIIMHAALLSVPTVQTHRNKYGVDEETSSPWGNAAFKLHVKLCQQAASESEKRELVRARFRACLLLTTPFILRIKADGTLTVQDLVERTDLNKLGMPPALLSQLEALLSTAISLSVQSKVVPTVRDHLSTSSEIFMVPMIFDPKFQRGPFDPYGRAPRIFPRLKLKGTQPNKHGGDASLDAGSVSASTASPPSKQSVVSGDREEGNGDDDDENDMPLGLWEKKQKKANKTLAASQAKKLFGFQSDAPVRDKGKGGEGGGEGESALPFDTAGSLPQTDNGTVAGGGGRGGEGESESGRQGSRQGSKQRSKKEMHNRARALKHDFEAHVRSGFERPYTCSHPGCDAAFSRAYSLKVHEKSHELFGGYHKFRQQPQLFLDPDVEDAKAAARAAFEASVSLPPLVQQEIYNLRAAAAAKAWALTYDEQERMHAEAKPSSRPTTAQLFGPELVFPKSEAPAVRAVNELPSSRGNDLPATPGSPWRLPRASKGLIDSPMSTPNRTPRAGSRGGMFSRGGSRSPTAPHMAITPWDQQWPDADSFPNTPLGSPSRSAAGTSRGSVTWADQVDDDVPLLSAPPIRFGMGLGPVDDD